METKNKSSFGQVVFEAGKYIYPREVISEAIMANGKGSLVHVWGLDDGETIVIHQDLNAPKSVVKNATVLIQGESSWKSWQAQKNDFDEVITKISSNGFRIKSAHKNPSYVSQMRLLQRDVPVS